MSGIQMMMLGSRGASVPAPTLSLTNSTITAGTSASGAIGTYTGTITSVVVNSGPGTSGNYVFSGGVVYYSGDLVYAHNGATINLTVSNAGGSANSSCVLTVTPLGFALTGTNLSFASGVTISFTPRKTILATTTSGNIISNGSVNSGAIPPGTTITFNQGGNGDVIIGGTPSVTGVYNFTLLTYDGGYSNISPVTSPTITITIT